MRLFVRGDVDGFFAIAMDNLIQLLLIPALCIGVVGMAPPFVYGRILPGIAVSYVVGNLFYAWQAHRLARLGFHAEAIDGRRRLRWDRVGV